MQTFLDISCGAGDKGEEDGERLLLLDSYLKSSPQCSEVLDLLTEKRTPHEVSVVLFVIDCNKDAANATNTVFNNTL